MKILSRIVLVLALLCSLGYGSYAFGKYVLTNKLFGNGASGNPVRTVSRSTGEASAVTQHTNWKGDKPRVEVKVLPADGEGTPTDVTESSGKPGPNDIAPPTDGKPIKRTFDEAKVEYSLGDEDGHHHRHSRRDKLKANTTTGGLAVGESVDKESPVPEGEGSTSAQPGDSSAISVSADGSEKPTIAEKPRSERRSRRNRRDHKRPRLESPVPKPEDGSNSDSEGSSAPSHSDGADSSPVPKPE
jgi:hypothetical protein